MTPIQVLIYDGCLASAVLLPVDLASQVSRHWHQQSGQGVRIRLLSIQGARVQSASGYPLDAQGRLDDVKAGDALVVHINPNLGANHQSQLDTLLTWWRSHRHRLGPVLSNDRRFNDHGHPGNWQQRCHQFVEQTLDVSLPALGVPMDDTEVLQTSKDQGMVKAQALIQKHLAEPVRIEQLASEVAMSQRTLTRRFRRYFGLSPTEYIQKQRLERCQMLLQDTQLDFGRIAQACGYKDDASLRKVFKKAFGESPYEYRLRHINQRPGSWAG